MILSVDKVNKSFGKKKILDNVSFEITKPEILALIGPNGAGKSTLLNVITNLASYDSGNVEILKKSNKDPKIFKDISFMQDNSVLYEYLTGYDHLQFIGDIQGLSKKRILMVSEKMGINNYLFNKVSTYSLGMKQHLLITMAILNTPKLLIMDEPLNGLDPSSSIKIRRLLLELRNEGTAILLSSHNLSEIDRVTTQVLFLKDGRVIREDLSVYQNTYYYLTVNVPNIAQNILAKEKIKTIGIEANKIILQTSPSHSLNNIMKVLLQDNIAILDIEKKVIGSEDRYQIIFGEKEFSK